MTKRTNWKKTIVGAAVALGIIAWIARKNGGTIAGNREGYRVEFDSDRFIDWVNIPLGLPYGALHGVKNAAKRILGQTGNRYGVKVKGRE